jgi:hypothetical protein
MKFYSTLYTIGIEFERFLTGGGGQEDDRQIIIEG